MYCFRIEFFPQPEGSVHLGIPGSSLINKVNFRQAQRVRFIGLIREMEIAPGRCVTSSKRTS